jgi:hypothetical protein
MSFYDIIVIIQKDLTRVHGLSTPNISVLDQKYSALGSKELKKRIGACFGICFL